MVRGLAGSTWREPSMRPRTLSEAYDRIIAGEPREKALAEFLDTFYGADTGEARYEVIKDEPAMTNDPRLDALAASSAEYLAKRYRLPKVPPWVSNPHRVLHEPWFTTQSTDPGMLEFLTFSSP